MNKKITKILTILLVSTFIACGQTTESNDKETKLNWETHKASDYSIQHPDSWELNQNGLMGTSFILFSPLESSKDKFRENINLLIQDLSDYNFDLNEYTKISEDQIKTLVTNSILIESKRIKDGSDEYHRMIYTGDQGIFHLKYEQFFWIKNDKAYILTLTCEQDKFSKFKKMGEAILNSFRFKY